MTSGAFAAVLGEPDSDASRLRLYELIVAQKFTGPNLPTVADEYLRAFCDVTSSMVRRRWIGIAFASMLGASTIVAARLKKSIRLSQAVGSIVLSDAEREETKIVAGIIIRQALAQGIEYSNFWASEKVRNSAPPFPKDLHPRWMANFQDFLDSLHSLALINATTEASIMYPVSVVTSDRYRWRESNDGVPVALIQNEVLTVIASDSDLCDIQAIDIPIAHICGIQLKRSVLHDSQAQQTDSEPWDLTLTLNAEVWTYRLNAAARTGTGVTFLLQHSADAKEWESCIKEHQKERMKSMSPSHPTTQLRAPCGSLVNDGSATQSQDSIHVSPVHQPSRAPPRTQPRAEFQRSSSGQPKGDPRLQTRETNANSSRQTRSQAEKHSEPGTMQNHEDEKSRGGMRNTNTMGRQGNDGLSPGQGSSSRADSPARKDHSEQGQAQSPGSKSRVTSSRGKLPRVSQLTQESANKELPVETDVFALPSDDSTESLSKRRATARIASHKKTSDPRPTSRKQSQSSVRSNGKTTSKKKSTRSQAKRKADDEIDEEFVPEKRSSKRKTVHNSKSGPSDGVSNKKSSKRARIDKAEDGTACETQSTAARSDMTTTPRTTTVEPARANEAPSLHDTRRASPEKSCPSNTTSRQSLIGALRDSQRPLDASIGTFKKPTLPMRSEHSPSTPAQSRCLGRMARLRTPIEGRKHLNGGSLPVALSSSPQSDELHEMEGGEDWEEHTLADTEILSSNSKPIPASPHAESTAISGHADREDIDSERRKGDIQTARSDPFRQRHQGSKATSFLRRLTGEGSSCDLYDPKESIPQIVLMQGRDTKLQKSRDAASQPAALPIPWNKNISGIAKDVNSGDRYINDNVTPRKTATLSQSILAITMGNADTSRHAKGAPCLWKPHSDASPASQQLARSPTGQKDHTVPSRAVVKPVEHQTGSTMAVHGVKDYGPGLRDLMHDGSYEPIDNSQIACPTQEPCEDGLDADGLDADGLDADGDSTLINDGVHDAATINSKFLTSDFPSSPPVPGSPSNHSSTSAGTASSTAPPPPSSDAEEMEWEASLLPHQRALHDVLIRTSKRVLRHIVDNETAVTDIAEVFGRDGEHILHSLLERHDSDYDVVFQDMEIKKNGIQRELHRALNHLAKERRRVSAMI